MKNNREEKDNEEQIKADDSSVKRIFGFYRLFAIKTQPVTTKK